MGSEQTRLEATEWLPHGHHPFKLATYALGRVANSRGHVASLGDELVVDRGVLEHGATRPSCRRFHCIGGYRVYVHGCRRYHRPRPTTVLRKAVPGMTPHPVPVPTADTAALDRVQTGITLCASMATLCCQ
jgi:hypothetical protein